jgi:hypothetical protein
MTISIATVTHQQLTAYHHEQDGVKGYRVVIGTASVFIPEAEADKLARYMLFTPPAQADH